MINGGLFFDMNQSSNINLIISLPIHDCHVAPRLCAIRLSLVEEHQECEHTRTGNMEHILTPMLLPHKQNVPIQTPTKERFLGDNFQVIGVRRCCIYAGVICEWWVYRLGVMERKHQYILDHIYRGIWAGWICWLHIILCLRSSSMNRSAGGLWSFRTIYMKIAFMYDIKAAIRGA